MKIKLVYIIFFFSTFLTFAQNGEQLSLITKHGTQYLPIYKRQGTVYLGIKHFAEVLSLNYYYNTKTDKIELKGDNYNLVVTAKNPFISLYSKVSGKRETYQIPTSTYLLDDEIFIPLKYTLDFLKKVTGLELNFSAHNQLFANTTIETRSKKLEENDNNSSAPFDISDLKIEQKANGTLIRVETKKRILSYNSFFKDGILTIIFRNVHADVSKIDLLNGKGLIKNISAKNINSDAEFKFTIGNQYSSSEVLNIDKSNDILIAIHNKIFTKNNLPEKEKEKWNFNVIVIDPGHGGKDSGTIGVHGIKEKDINLAIGLKLGHIIEKNMKDVKVVYTRKTDRFIELYKRGKIANEAGGNLFISIHCNATPKKPSKAEGFEVYLLRPGRTKEAIQIAERENSVISYEDNPSRYQKLTDENFILVTMAQSAYMKYSENFSDLLNKEFSKDIGISSRGVKQAGFYVLVGASMPSVLIETGFLSNKHDAEYLNSSRGQTKIADAIYEAIKQFKAHYNKSLNSE